MDSTKVLVVIPNSSIGDRIEQAFYRANFEVVRTDDSRRAINLLKTENPQVMVVDRDLVNGTIKEITQLLQKRCRKTALVLLSKNKKVEERIHALDNGADDCLVKPLEVDELVAKVKALIRRIQIVDHEPKTLRIKDLDINLDTHEVRKEGRLIDLTYTQFKLLYLLVSNRGYVFTRDEILKKVWGENVYVTDRTVDVHVKRLREKLGEQKYSSKYIQTIHGLGYRFA